MATSDDLAQFTKQLASIETHAKAVLSWVAEARKSLTALTTDTKSEPVTTTYGGY